MKRSQKESTIKQISNIVKDAANKINPQKVILFGSYAYGNPNKDSDIDLLFIKETKLPKLRRYCLISDSLRHVFPIDILVKTREEIKRRLAMGDPFYKDIINKGIILYESHK